MSFLHIVFCCLTIYNISEGRNVSGIIGQNISFSWTFNIIKNDAVFILHNGSRIHRFFPNNQSSVPREPPHRVSFSVGFAPKNVTVTINVLNLTENDAGTYRVVRSWNLDDLEESVNLQMTESTCFTTTLLSQKVSTEGTNHSTATALRQNDDTEGINHHTTAAMAPEVDADFPAKIHLLYIILGMGGILALAFLACILYQIRKCLSMERVSNRHTFTDATKNDGDERLQEENMSGNYWTIESNERELSSAIATHFERRSDQTLIAQTMATTNNTSDMFRPDHIKINEEFDGYLSPVYSCPVESDEFTCQVHSCPVELDECILSVQPDPVITDFVSTDQTSEF